MEVLPAHHRKFLKGQAHHLKPVIIVGAKGISEQLITAVDEALNDHELIKIKFGEFKESKTEFSEKISKETNSSIVGLIGHIAVFYRTNPDPEKRKIQLPRA